MDIDDIQDWARSYAQQMVSANDGMPTLAVIITADGNGRPFPLNGDPAEAPVLRKMIAAAEAAACVVFFHIAARGAGYEPAGGSSLQGHPEQFVVMQFSTVDGAERNLVAPLLPGNILGEAKETCDLVGPFDNLFEPATPPPTLH